MDGTAKIARDERARAILRELRDRYGSTAALARALGVAGPTITEVLNAKRGVGLDLLDSLADLTGRSLDDLCGRQAATRRVLRDLPRWADARAEAEVRLRHVRADVLTAALDRVGGFALPDTSIALTGLFVAKLAEAVISSPGEF